MSTVKILVIVLAVVLLGLISVFVMTGGDMDSVLDMGKTDTKEDTTPQPPALPE